MKYYSTLVFVCICLGLYAQKWDKDPVISQAHSSAVFIDIETGENILAYNQYKILNPASTIKLLTSLIILEEKGEEFQYETNVLYTGTIENDGTLKGDLIIQGSGDPSLGSSRYGEENSTNAFLKKCVAYAQKKGITCIDGNIVVDASVFGTDCVPHSWPYNDLGNYYAAGAWGINVNENSYKLGFGRKGNTINSLTIQPEIPEIYFSNELEIGPADSGDQAYIFCAPYQNHAYIRGSIPKGKGTFSIRGSMPNAPKFLGVSLQNLLDKNGIKSQKVEVEFEKKRTGKTIYSHKGIPLGRQVKSAIQKSINLYCEAFLLTLGDGDRSKGILKIEDYLERNNCISDDHHVQISDGSGLSQRNYISAETQAKFLRVQYLRNKNIKNVLARNGYDGTLKNKFTSKSLKGKIYGKSGSMGNVRAYTGILKTNSGKELSFSIMVNNYTTSYRKVDKHIEELLLEAVKK
jgi:D-alanyl-D-alanine carboxypeptidase/D-alanyl-D-alanine-endopeptidase (penicillin-binding protein 4)